ncbi:MAG TPA: hypothetical protein VI653_00565 [Steroidobacteraceae bacterium]
MSASDDLKPWFDLQSATLHRVHPSWFRNIEPQLILAARRDARGRRWLANHLASSSPALFSLTEWRSEAASRLGASAWLAQPLEEAMECALELGAVALAGAIRTVVARDGVMKLRLALGAARYDRVLQSNVVAAPSSERPVWTSEAVESITDHIARRGAMELAGYADNIHPAWGESVRLSFERWWWMSPSEATLPATVVEVSLRPPETLYEVVLTGTDS